MLGYRRDLTASTLRRRDRASAQHRARHRGRREPVLLRRAPRHRGRRPHARRADVRRLLRRGPGARARARRGVRRPRRRRPRHRPLHAATRATCRASATPGRRSSSSTARRASSTPTPSSPTTPAARATAVEHLLAAGHRRIAFLGDRPSIFTADERRRGYREALAAAGSRPTRARAHRARRQRRPRRPRRRAARGRRAADGAVHRTEPDHDRRHARVARAGAPARASRWSASTTSCSPTCSTGHHRRRAGPLRARPPGGRAAVLPARRRRAAHAAGRRCRRELVHAARARSPPARCRHEPSPGGASSSPARR